MPPRWVDSSGAPDKCKEDAFSVIAGLYLPMVGHCLWNTAMIDLAGQLTMLNKEGQEFCEPKVRAWICLLHQAPKWFELKLPS